MAAAIFFLSLLAAVVGAFFAAVLMAWLWSFAAIGAADEVVRAK